MVDLGLPGLEATGVVLGAAFASAFAAWQARRARLTMGQAPKSGHPGDTLVGMVSELLHVTSTNRDKLDELAADVRSHDERQTRLTEMVAGHGQRLEHIEQRLDDGE